MNTSQLSINSISTRQKNLEEALKAYAEAGFRNVEFHLPLAKDWLAQGRYIPDLKRLLDQHNLRCIGGFEAHLACFSSTADKSENHNLHLRNAQLIHELGGGTLVVGTDGPEKPSLEAVHTVGRVLREVADRMDGLDVNLALEFNWSPVIRSLKSAAIACREADHPRVGILFDPAHYYTTVTKPEHLTPEVVSLIRHVHLNDMQDKPGEWSNCNSDRVLPGAGILDLPTLLSLLDRNGYQGFYSIEMFNEELWQLPTSEAARRCYQSLLPLCQP